MLEKDVNRIITNAIKKDGFGFKIGDFATSQGFASESPFDLFGVLKEGFLYFESKFKRGNGAFNFSKIEDHQIRNLNLIKKLQPTAITLYPIGAYEPRKYFNVFLLDSPLVPYLQSKEKKSILKKEFLRLIELEMFIPIIRNKEKKEYEINLTNFLDKVITIEFWKDNLEKEY